MYNKATIDQIAGALGLNAEEFATGFTSEKEVELKLNEGRFLTKQQEETLKDNHGKSRYDAGAEASRDMTLKEMSKMVDFEESIKDPKKFIDAFKTKILENAKVEPNKKINDLESSITNLQSKLVEKDEDYLNLQKDFNIKQLKFDVKSFIPDIPDSLGISKDDATNLFFLSREVKDGQVFKEGNVIKDSLENPLSIHDAVDSFITEKGWNLVPKGRGGGAQGQGNVIPKTMEDYQSTLKDRGINEGSAEANALLQEIAKEHPEILE